MLILGACFSCGDALGAIAAYSSTYTEIFALDLHQRRLSNHQRALAGTKHSDHVAMLVAQQLWWRARQRGDDEEMRFCDWKGLQMSTMRVMFETKRQLLDLLVQAGFPEESMVPGYIDQSQPDAQLDVALALLCVGLYPNVCVHKEKRKVLTTESKAALIHKTSVNCSNLAVQFPYPFFVFGEKIRTRAVSCKQMSMVAPVQLLLFGSKSVDRVGVQTVRLDRWINFQMDPQHAALVVALRPAIEELVLKVSAEPDRLLRLDEQQQRLIALVRDLCRMDAGDFELQRTSSGAALPMPTGGEDEDYFGGGTNVPMVMNSSYGGGGGRRGGGPSGFGGGKYARMGGEGGGFGGGGGRYGGDMNQNGGGSRGSFNSGGGGYQRGGGSFQSMGRAGGYGGNQYFALQRGNNSGGGNNEGGGGNNVDGGNPNNYGGGGNGGGGNGGDGYRGQNNIGGGGSFQNNGGGGSWRRGGGGGGSFQSRRY